MTGTRPDEEGFGFPSWRWTQNKFTASLAGAALFQFLLVSISYLSGVKTVDKNTAIASLLVLIVAVIIIALFYALPWIQVKLRGKGVLENTLLRLVTIITVVLRFLGHPILLSIYFIFLLAALISSDSESVRLVIATVLFFLFVFALLKSNKTNVRAWTQKKPLVVDGFENLHGWAILSGTPTILESDGNPPPCLELPYVNGVNTFLLNESIRINDGIIECDVYPDEGSLFNIVFRASDGNTYYMARLDTRPSYFDSILINDGVGRGWQTIKDSNRRTLAKQWHHMKVIFKEKRISLLIDNELVLSIGDDRLQGGQVGYFNEVGKVLLDNFVVYQD